MNTPLQRLIAQREELADRIMREQIKLKELDGMIAELRLPSADKPRIDFRAQTEALRKRMQKRREEFTAAYQRGDSYDELAAAFDLGDGSRVNYVVRELFKIPSRRKRVRQT